MFVNSVIDGQRAQGRMVVLRTYSEVALATRMELGESRTGTGLKY